MKRAYLFLIALAIMAGINLQVWAAQPLPQTDGSVYYYVAFVRLGTNAGFVNHRGVLEDQGDGNQLQTGALDPGNPAQLWVITGTDNGSLVFTSKLGNKVIFDENFKTSSTLEGEPLTILDCAAASGAGTVYQIHKGADAAGNFMNPEGGSGIGKPIAGYNNADGGNALTFISEKTVPLVSPADHSADVWYYMYYTRNNRGYVKDNGIDENITHVGDVVEYSDDYLWRVVSTEDGTGRFYIESKAGRRIGFSTNYKAMEPNNSAVSLFHINGVSLAGDGNDAHLPILSDGATIMNALSGTLFGRYTWYNDLGQAVIFAPVSTYPKISSGNINYWYRIGFSNRVSDAFVIQDQGAGANLLQTAKTASAEAQYWTLKGADKSNFKVESKLGNQFASTSKQTIAADGGDSYSLAKSAYATISGQGLNKGEGKIRWQLYRSGGSYVNSDGGGNPSNTGVGEWNNGDQNNSLNFEPVPAIYLTSSSSTLSFIGAAINVTSLPQTVTVEALGLSSSITYTVTDNTDGVFSVTPATGWNNRDGGALEITFTPTEFQTYGPRTLTISSADAEISVDITLTGINTNGALIITNPENLDFGNVDFGKIAKPRQIQLTGYNLTADAVAYVLGGDDAGNFTVTPASPLTPSAGSLDQTLTIGFTAGAKEAYAATLTVTGGGITNPHVVNLTATGITPNTPLPIGEYGYIQLVNTGSVDASIRYDFLEDNGTDAAVEMRPAKSGAAGAGIDAQLWKITDTNATNQYQIVSKAGTILDYDGTNWVTAETSTATFDFVKDGNRWKIKHNEEDDTFISRANTTADTYTTDDKLTASATAAHFTMHAGDLVFPKISTDENEYWYKVRNQAITIKDGGPGEKDVIGSCGVGLGAENNTTLELWKLVAGDKEGGYKFVTYAGNQLYAGSNSTTTDYYIKQQTVADDGNDYALEKLGTGWALRNLDKRATGLPNYGYYVSVGNGMLEQWSNDGSAKYTFTFTEPVPQDFVIAATESKSAADYNPLLHADIVFRSTDDATGQLTGIPAEGLTVNGVVKLEKTFTYATDYPIGFPFAVATVSDATYGLKSYNGATNLFEPATTIDAGEGYLINFPAVEGATEVAVTFTSAANPTLSNASTAAATGYNLVANPSVSNITAITDAEAYYVFDATGGKFVSAETAFTVKPFEALVTVKDVTGTLYETIGSGLPNALNGVDSNDPVVSTKYYTLQGWEVQRPVENGVYIIKNTRASQKTEVVKVFFRK
jgi:hypothetical protein